MAETTAVSEKVVQEVQVEDIGPARKRLTITVPPEAIQEKLEASMETLMAETAIPGFRKGRAPRSLMQRRFGSAVKQETRNQIVADAYAGAIEDKGIRPVGEPEPSTPLDELEIEEGKPLTFSVDVEVVPEFDLPSLDGIEIKKPSLEITEDHIQAEIKRQCLQMGEAHKIEGDFAEGDRLVGHATATRKGEDEPFFTHDEVLIVVPGEADGGRGQVLGLLIDGLADMIKDKKVGDNLTIETTVPEGHEREDIRGKDITIEIQIRHAERIEPAEVSQIVEHFGMGSEDVLREQIKLALEQRLHAEQANAMREQLYEHLLKSVDFDLPEKLSASQATRLLEQHRIELLYRGLTPEQVEDRLAEARAQSEKVARDRLKLFFVLHRLAEQFEIQVSEQEINGRIAEIAMQRGHRPEQLRNELAQSGRINEVAMQIRNHKTADRVIQQAKVEEIPAEEWRQIVQARQAEQKATAGAKAASSKTTKKKSSSKKTSSKTSTSKKSSSKKSSS